MGLYHSARCGKRIFSNRRRCDIIKEIAAAKDWCWVIDRRKRGRVLERMNKNPHSGHRARLRDRFRREGYDLDHFEPHNILELMLFYCAPQKDTNELAHLLIDEFGSISGVFDAPYEELVKVSGVGEYTATFIKTIPALFRVYETDRLKDEAVLDSAQAARRYFIPKFIGRTEELVYVACLDSECKVKCCEIVSHGTVSAAAVNVRKIAEYAMRYNAANVIVAHNHPYGLAVASPEDIMTTDAICYALQLIGIVLTDHIIVANDQALSLAEAGVIKKK